MQQFTPKQHVVMWGINILFILIGGPIIYSLFAILDILGVDGFVILLAVFVGSYFVCWVFECIQAKVFKRYGIHI